MGAAGAHQWQPEKEWPETVQRESPDVLPPHSPSQAMGSVPRSLALALQSYGLASSLISAQTENKSLKCKVEVWLSSDLPGKNALLRSMLGTLGWLQEYQNWSSPLLPVPVETYSLRWAMWAVSLPSSYISWTWLMFMRPLTTIDVFVFKVPYDWLPLTKYASWSMIFLYTRANFIGKN